MAFFTANTKSFKFPDLPNNKGRTKSAFVTGFANAVAGSKLGPSEKLAWLKYAAEQLPQGPAQEEINPVEGPGPGFMPEGQEGPPGGGGEDAAALEQLLASLPGNTPEEKLQAAVELIMQLEGQGGGQPGQGPEIPQGPQGMQGPPPGPPAGQGGPRGNPFAGGPPPR